MKILIAGGGIGGLTAALCLAKRFSNDDSCAGEVTSPHIEVFEQASQFEEAGAGIQLSPNCVRVLHHLGLEDAIRESAFLPEATQFRQWKSGKVISENPLGAQTIKQYGHPYYHIHRGDLLALLVEAARQQAEITLHTDAKVLGFEQDPSRTTLILENHRVEGDVLIGADGIHSKIRQGLWGDDQPNFTGNIAWRALVPADALPANRIRPMSTAWWGPNKHFVHYYVRRGELINCVCVVEKRGWDTESWTELGDVAELKRDFSGWHEDIQLLIDNAQQDSLYKWALFDRAPMSQWGKGKVTLLGDACHPTLPFMAQGAAMAIEDAAVLATTLEQSADVEAALSTYEELRKTRTAGIQRGSRRNATIFHLAGVKAWLRNRAAKQAGARALDHIFRYDPLNAS